MLGNEPDFIQVDVWEVVQRIERVYCRGRSAYERIADAGKTRLPPKYPVTSTH